MKKKIRGLPKAYQNRKAYDKHLKRKDAPLKKGKKGSHEGKVQVAKGVKLKRGQEEKLRAKPGSSSTGRYKNVKPKDFAGSAGGASKFSFPIPDLAHARNALARAHFAPNPEGIKRKVYAKFPELKKRHEEREKGKKPKKIKHK